MNKIKLLNILFENDGDSSQIVFQTARNLLKQILALFSNKPKEELINYFVKDNSGRLTNVRLQFLNKNLNNVFLSIKDKVIYGADVNSELLIEDPEQDGNNEIHIIIYWQFPAKTQESIDAYNQWLLSNFIKILYKQQQFFIKEFVNAHNEDYINYLITPKELPKKQKTQQKNNAPPDDDKLKNLDNEELEQIYNTIEKQLSPEDKKVISKDGIGKWIAQIGINNLISKSQKTMPPALYKFFIKNLSQALKDSPVSTTMSHYY